MKEPPRRASGLLPPEGAVSGFGRPGATDGPPGIIVTDADGIRRLRIDRPGSGNALRGQDLVALAEVVERSRRDEGIRVLVISGSGEKFFCCGSDIDELSGGVPDIGRHLSKWHDLVDAVEASPKPVIAAINGSAVGGGLELALACHLRVAIASAKLGLPEVKVGLFPAAGGVRKLTRLLGASRALDLVLSGRLLQAEAAVGLGLVNQAVPADEHESAVEALAQALCQLEPNVVAAVLECAHAPTHGKDSNQLETDLLRSCYENPRNREVLQSFLTRPKTARR